MLYILSPNLLNMAFPTRRLRRLRRTDGLRRLVRDTRVVPSDLVYPIFVDEGIDDRKPLGSISGIDKIPLEMVGDEVREVYDLGIPAIMLFGIPENKDSEGTSAYDDAGIIQNAIKEARKGQREMVIISDVCMCQYVTTGHCGLYKEGSVDNDSTIDVLGKIAVSYARAGADMVSPSAMMDGQVATIRAALDSQRFDNVSIMPHTTKHFSSLYAPFRVAARSAPQFGERDGYQVPYTNPREAMMEVETDIEEGADIIMIKPAIMYLDLVAETRRRFDVPIAAFSVSGEYALARAAHIQGWVDQARLAQEMLGSIKRAGADIIITYFAKDIAKSLT